MKRSNYTGMLVVALLTFTLPVQALEEADKESLRQCLPDKALYQETLGIEINQTALDFIEGLINKGVMSIGQLPNYLESEEIIHCTLKYGVSDIVYGGGFGDVDLKWSGPSEQILSVSVGHFFGQIHGNFGARWKSEDACPHGNIFGTPATLSVKGHGSLLFRPVIDPENKLRFEAVEVNVGGLKFNFELGGLGEEVLTFIALQMQNSLVMAAPTAFAEASYMPTLNIMATANALIAGFFGDEVIDLMINSFQGLAADLMEDSLRRYLEKTTEKILFEEIYSTNQDNLSDQFGVAAKDHPYSDIGVRSILSAINIDEQGGVFSFDAGATALPVEPPAENEEDCGTRPMPPSYFTPFEVPVPSSDMFRIFVSEEFTNDILHALHATTFSGPIDVDEISVPKALNIAPELVQSIKDSTGISLDKLVFRPKMELPEPLNINYEYNAVTLNFKSLRFSLFVENSASLLSGFLLPLVEVQTSLKIGGGFDVNKLSNAVYFSPDSRAIEIGPLDIKLLGLIDVSAERLRYFIDNWVVPAMLVLIGDPVVSPAIFPDDIPPFEFEPTNALESTTGGINSPGGFYLSLEDISFQERYASISANIYSSEDPDADLAEPNTVIIGEDASSQDRNVPEKAEYAGDIPVYRSNDLVFSFAGDDDLSPTVLYSWKLDNGPWSPYRPENEVRFGLDDLSGHDFRLLEGEHVLMVRSRDEALNIDQTPAVYHFLVESSEEAADDSGQEDHASFPTPHHSHGGGCSISEPPSFPPGEYGFNQVNLSLLVFIFIALIFRIRKLTRHHFARRSSP